MDKSMKRVLFVNHMAGISGPTHSLMNFARHLSSRYEIEVLLPETGMLSEWLAEQEIPTYIIPGLRHGSIFQIFRLLRQRRVDLVYGNTPNTSARNALFAARMAGLPFIWHFRGVKWHWGWRKGYFLRWANRIIAVSQACANSLARFYPLDKIQVIYNGVELSFFAGDHGRGRAYLAEQAGLPGDARVLISVSHIKPRKGQEEAVAIMSDLVQRTEQVHLVIAGSLDRDPAFTHLLRGIIRQKGLEDRIHLLGMRTDIPQLLAGADIFLHLAREDAHPRAVIEAMAAGLPVVAFGVDGVAETVVDGQTGYLAPKKDCARIARQVHVLLEDPALATTFGRQAQQHIEQHFTAASTAGKIARVIDEVLKG